MGGTASGRIDGELEAMHPAKAASTDRSAAVVPETRSVAPWRVVSLEVLGAGRLRVRFVDGTEGEVSMQAFLADSSVAGTVFEALRDPGEFAKARVAMGAVAWPSGADLAPDAMYDAIRRDGVWNLS